MKSSVECKEGEYATHPRDCNKYLQCLWGNFIVNSCPSGLYWNNVKFKLDNNIIIACYNCYLNTEAHAL